MANRYQQLGSFLQSHMTICVPACVAVGVLLPQVFGPVSAVGPLMFAIMTFQGSLNNTFRQLMQMFRHPLHLLIILGVIMVLMPALAFACASALFAGNTDLITGIVLEYSVPIGVVSFMWVGMYRGNTSLALAAILVSTVVSPLTIPATLSILLGATVHIDALGMVVDMIFMIAVPAIAGMAVNELTRGWGHERLSPAISPACRVLMLLNITANSTKMSAYVLDMNLQRIEAALFVLVFATSGFMIGLAIARLLHGSQDLLVTMSFDCGLRNISSGATLAAQYFPGEAVFPIMCGTIFQQVLAATFGRTIERICSEDTAERDRKIGIAKALVSRHRQQRR